MKTVNVVAAVIKKGSKILATQRGYGEFKDGWEFPGGKIEVGETPEQALKREIKEELNAKIEIGTDLGVVEYDYPAFHLKMRCYICTLCSGDVTLLEHEAMRWLGLKELKSVAWLPADVALIDKIAVMLEKENNG